MARLFIKQIKHEKIIATTETKVTLPISASYLNDILSQVLRPLDIAVPIILSKHISEIKNFYKTSFLKDDFMENIYFSRLEVEIIIDKKKKKNICK
ncbi:MAG: hypothetical protein R2876_05645 [Eubacteriales bacterium]